ncbi:MAG: hypothetical protein H6556_23065 [Lewinellaceae bacterium]|nr:hypothetical protein [Lewinellaceae bacterium]
MPASKAPHSLIFYRFFQRLRQEVGIELDARQYRNFLHCLLLGTVKDKADMLELCKTMWLTRPQFRPRFEEIFEEVPPSCPNIGLILWRRPVWFSRRERSRLRRPTSVPAR